MDEHDAQKVSRHHEVKPEHEDETNRETAAKKIWTVRHPPRSGWLDELGRLKGGWAKGLGVARCAPY